MISGYQDKILKMYENIREKEAAALKERKKQIRETYPQILEMEKEIGKLCVEVSINTLKNMENRDKYLTELKEKIIDLKMSKCELLVQHGYPQDYLELHYICNKCKDTGFIGNDKCTCYRQKMVQIYYKNIDFKDQLQRNNFNNFSLELYSSEKSPNKPDSPRKNMEKIKNSALNFIDKFSSTSENLFFYGSAGTGKTFLSHCIAKDLLDNGNLVVYRTAQDLIQNLRQIRFTGDKSLESLIFNCDLLIIDDLGTEETTDLSSTELFNLLNKKLLKRKKMIISTNLGLNDLLKNYSDRITSRLLGNFSVFQFYGEDIRIKMNLDKIKN